MTPEEIKLEIKAYFKLANTISYFERLKSIDRKNYYASQSFVGGMIKDPAFNVYQMPLSVEKHALKLYEKEQAIKTKITKLRDREKYFNRYLNTINVKELEKALSDNYCKLTEIEVITYNEIKEIETFIKLKYGFYLRNAQVDLEANEPVLHTKLCEENDRKETSIFNRLRSLGYD